MSLASSSVHPRVGLILTGGGARAAYQVGVLQAIAAMLPKGSRNPFPVICGTSAGAINAASLAGSARNFHEGWADWHWCGVMPMLAKCTAPTPSVYLATAHAGSLHYSLEG